MGRAMWLVVGLGIGCSGKNQPEPPTPAPQEPADAAEQPTDEAPVPVPGEAPVDPDGGPQRCGGIAGFRCPDKMACGDDPTDGCDPKAGGADCMGICMACDDPRIKRNYSTNTPEQCKKSRISCGGGFRPFNDACGCGCTEL